jgi:hypothetical protein
MAVPSKLQEGVHSTCTATSVLAELMKKDYFGQMVSTVHNDASGIFPLCFFTMAR